MMYLKPLVKKIITDESKFREVGPIINSIKDDKEMLELLLNFTTIKNIEDVFEHHYGVEYKNINNMMIDKELIGNFDINFLKREVILPFAYDSDKSLYHLSISDLMNRDLQTRIKKLFSDRNQRVKLYFTFEHELLGKLNEIQSTTPASTTSENIPTSVTRQSNTDSEDDVDFDATTWVNNVLDKGAELGASDIHIEKLENEMQIRYRVDGLLTNKQMFNLSENAISRIYVRLKIISNMDIVESRRSQDGRIDNYAYGEDIYDMRVSSVNTIYGEKFVLRMIKKTAGVVPFSALGFTKEGEATVKDMLGNQNGIIYLAGATGSGKTTTLYTMIDELKDDSVNIYTIEDPVEKTIPEINQIQIDEANGTDYPTILSALLRQDPNVIVVGEIRDSETAELSIRASLTGHLVLSTIHSNSAVDSLSRLSDMGVEPYLVGASMVGVLSQRLLRKLCDKCKIKREELSLHEEMWVKSVVPDFDYEEEKAKGNYVYEASSCDSCSDGYKGRVAAVEVLQIDDTLRTMISKRAETSEIEDYLYEQGYKDLRHDGLIKVLNGITSMNEIMGQL